MTFRLDHVIPWGRSYEEYVRMFDLTEDDLTKRILGCADGPSSFNAEATRRGKHVVSCDPLYAQPAVEIAERIRATFDSVMTQLRENTADFVWTQFPTPDDCGRVRLEAMRQFLLDLEEGKSQRRYVEGSLPRLPFGDQSFDIALCSHLLFTYSSVLTVEFHREAIIELCRVAREVRLFPLVDLAGQQVPYIELLVSMLTGKGYFVQQRPVHYEFQKGADNMLCISRTA